MDLLAGYGSDNDSAETSEDHLEPAIEPALQPSSEPSPEPSESKPTHIGEKTSATVEYPKKLQSSVAPPSRRHGIEPGMPVAEQATDLPLAELNEACSMLETRSSPCVCSLREDEARRRTDEGAPNEVTSFFDDGSVVACPSNEYGEYGKQKIICARNTHLLGLKSDGDAIVIGRKVC